MRHYLTFKTGGAIPNVRAVYEAFKDHARSPEMAAAGVDALVADIHPYAGYYCAMALDKEPDKDLAAAFRGPDRDRRARHEEHGGACAPPAARVGRGGETAGLRGPVHSAPDAEAGNAGPARIVAAAPQRTQALMRCAHWSMTC